MALEDVLNNFEEFEQGQKWLGKIQDQDRPVLRNTAIQEARAYAHSAITSGDHPPVPLSVVPTPDTLEDHYVEIGVGRGNLKVLKDTVRQLYDERENILGSQIQEPEWNFLGNRKEIIDRASPEYKKLLQMSSAYEHARDLAQRVADAPNDTRALAEIEDGKEREIILGSAKEVYIERLREHNANYGEDLMVIDEKLIKMRYSEGKVTQEELIGGVNAFRDVFERAYNEYVAVTGGKTAQQYISDTLKTMIEGDRKEALAAAKLLYVARRETADAA